MNTELDLLPELHDELYGHGAQNWRTLSEDSLQ